MNKIKPKEWKCYTCNFVGPTKLFETQSQHLCPECKSEDSFPHWKVKCIRCGGIHPFADIFLEETLDEDPRFCLAHKQTFKDVVGCRTRFNPVEGEYFRSVCGNKLFVLIEYERA